MFYKKYRLYDEGMEIMIPSGFKPADYFGVSQYSWTAEDKRVVIHVARGGADLAADELNKRLNEYYKGFHRDITCFECTHIAKRSVSGQAFGEIRYLSHMMGYCFYNIFLLGSYEGRELIVTLQCLAHDRTANAHIFENISDSLRLLRRQENDTEDGRHAG
ncbi:MAG: hypothetical protein J6C19_08565 [Lachnospiraceae bacterium]|nr:hypothetical protein [Lachnospiraceae bacterium]